jgi:hypothetical protein
MGQSVNACGPRGRSGTVPVPNVVSASVVVGAGNCGLPAGRGVGSIGAKVAGVGYWPFDELRV